jgi:TPR repeat protein
MHKSNDDSKQLFRMAEQCEQRGELTEAFEYLAAAARLGDSSSQLNIANFYSEGKGVPKNVREANKWYKRAFRNGERAAAFNLALDLEKQGQFNAAKRWLKKGVALNDGDAFVALVKCYRSKHRQSELLKKALSLSDDDITTDARDEAKAMLKELDV